MYMIVSEMRTHEDVGAQVWPPAGGMYVFAPALARSLDQSPPRSMAFRGKCIEVIEDLRNHFDEADPYLAWTAPLVVRAAIDEKVESSRVTHNVVRTAAAFLLRIYKGTAEPSELDALTDNFRELGLLDRKVEQQEDSITHLSTNVPAIESVTKDLVNQLGGQSILFICLAHGSVPAGAGVFLGYQHAMPTDSMFYPVRFSTYKHQDMAPQLDQAELAMLAQAARQGRRVVVFDEDSHSGRTIEQAEAFFASCFSPRQGEILPVVVEDRRPGRYK